MSEGPHHPSLSIKAENLGLYTPWPQAPTSRPRNGRCDNIGALECSDLSRLLLPGGSTGHICPDALLLKSPPTTGVICAFFRSSIKAPRAWKHLAGPVASSNNSVMDCCPRVHITLPRLLGGRGTDTNHDRRQQGLRDEGTFGKVPE